MPEDRITEALERWQAGEDREQNFRVLVESTYRRVLGIFLARGASVEDARDLTQECFVRVYRGLSDFRRESHFETWVQSIAINVYRKSRRGMSAEKRRHERSTDSLTEESVQRRAELEGRESVRSGAPAFEDLVASETKARLRAAVAELPPRMRNCLALRVYQELSYEEIATIMGLAVETVKAHLHQARRRLRTTLESELERNRS